MPGGPRGGRQREGKVVSATLVGPCGCPVPCCRPVWSRLKLAARAHWRHRQEATEACRLPPTLTTPRSCLSVSDMGECGWEAEFSSEDVANLLLEASSAGGAPLLLVSAVSVEVGIQAHSCHAGHAQASKVVCGSQTCAHVARRVGCAPQSSSRLPFTPPARGLPTQTPGRPRAGAGCHAGFPGAGARLREDEVYHWWGRGRARPLCVRRAHEAASCA